MAGVLMQKVLGSVLSVSKWQRVNVGGPSELLSMLGAGLRKLLVVVSA